MCPNCIRGLVQGTNEVCEECGGTGLAVEVKEVEVKEAKPREEKEVKKGKK